MLSGCSSSQKGRSFFTPVSEGERRVMNDKLFVEAIAHKTKGEYENAIVILNNILKSKDQQKAPVYYELARIYKDLKKFEEARKNIQKAIDLNAKNKWFYELNLQIAYDLQDAAEIESAFRVRKKAFPKNSDYDIEFSDFYLRQKKYNEVIKLYDEIESKIGVNQKLNHQKFLIYKSLDEYEKAEKEINKLIKAFPAESQNYIDLASFKFLYGEEKSAFEVYEEGLKINPDDPYILNEMARYYMNNGQQSKGYELYQKVLANPTFNPTSKIDILRGFIRLGEIDKIAYQKTKNYMELTADVHPYNHKINMYAGDFYFKDQQYEKSAQYYETAIELNSNNYNAWRQLILCFYNISSFEKMNEVAEEALTYYPTQPELFLYCGLALVQLKEYNKAIELLEEGNDFVPSKNKPLKAQFLGALADAYHANNEHEKSDEYFELTLEIDPNNYFVLNNYAYYLSLRKKSLEKAKKLSKKSIDLYPNESSFHDTYGWILYLLGDHEGALEWLKKSVENGGESSAVINEHMGDVYFELGDRRLARKYWEKALSLDGHSEELPQKINKVK